MTPLSRPRHDLALLLGSVAVAALMLTPGSGLPDLESFGWLDKLAHASAFAVHCGLLYRWLAAAPRRRAGLPAAALGSAGYATVLEVLQIWVPERRWDWWDLAADAVGIAVVVLVLGGSRARLRGGF